MTPDKTNQDLFSQACTVIPGGVSSPVRAWGSVGGTPRFIQRAQGAWIWDESDTRYLDLIGSWGPAILGHCHPDVVSAVQDAACRGLSFGAPTRQEVTLAELITSRMPMIDQVRFVSTGTEATMTAIRLARAATGRDLLVKFVGCYHGHSDSLLVHAGSGLATAGQASSAGVPASIAAETIAIPYNDVDALRQVFINYPDRIAAIITEAAPANMGVVPPDHGFNHRIHKLTQRHGALMICDEVLTGFRCSPQGFWAIDQDHGRWTPDLVTFGKVIGGGMPLAALGGRAELMEMLAPLGPVYQAGTLSGNPLATTAGIETLTRVDDDLNHLLNQVSDQVVSSLTTHLNTEGVPHRVQRVGSLFSVFFGEQAMAQPIRNFDDANAQDQQLFKAFFHAATEAKILLPPSCFEAWFVSAAHNDDEVLDHLDRGIAAAARAAGQYLLTSKKTDRR